MSSPDQLDQNQIFCFQPLTNLFPIIKWPVSHRMTIHSPTFLPPLTHFSMCVICVHVSKSFLRDRFCLPPGHYESGPLHVFCQALFRKESTQSNMAAHWFLSQINLLQLGAIGTSLLIHLSFLHWFDSALMSFFVFRLPFSLPFLHLSFFISQGQTLNTCSWMTDGVCESLQEELNEGSHISSSAICPDSLSRLVLMKSHLSLACLHSISLCLIVLILRMALSGAWGLWVYVRLSLSLSVYDRMHQFFIHLMCLCMVQYTLAAVQNIFGMLICSCFNPVWQATRKQAIKSEMLLLWAWIMLKHELRLK